MDKKFSLKSLAFPIYIDMVLRLATGLINTYMVSLVSVDLVGALGAGNEIFGQYLVAFEMVAVLLLVALICAVVLTHKEMDRETKGQK